MVKFASLHEAHLAARLLQGVEPEAEAGGKSTSAAGGSDSSSSGGNGGRALHVTVVH